MRRTLKLARMKGAAEPAAGGAQCKYLALIMDGNGRWAQQKRLPVAAGHRAGAKALRRVLEHALDLGIKEVTAYAFSTENWSRPENEVHALMDLFIEQIESQVPDMHDRGARIRFVGSREGVPSGLVRRIDEAEALTAGNERMTLFIAFNYGARQEILSAASALAREWAKGGGAAAAGGPRAAAPSAAAPSAAPSAAAPSAAVPSGSPVFTADDLHRHLYAPEMHDPELLVRTSGEQRISNFLLWQLAYSELPEQLEMRCSPDVRTRSSGSCISGVEVTVEVVGREDGGPDGTAADPAADPTTARRRTGRRRAARLRRPRRRPSPGSARQCRRRAPGSPAGRRS